MYGVAGSEPQRTVAGTVSWSIESRAGWRGTVARAAEVVAAIADGSGNGWTLRPTDATVPYAAGTPLKLEAPLVRGRASFMPRFWEDPGVPIDMYPDRATVTVPRRFAMIERAVPLTRFAIVSSRHLSGAWFPKGPTATWELTLTSDENEEITVTGAWLSLAWLAHLGRWREPTWS